MLYKNLAARFRRVSVLSLFVKLFVAACEVGLFLLFTSQVEAQSFERELNASERPRITIRNLHGGVRLTASNEPEANRIIIRASSPAGGEMTESNVSVAAAGDSFEIETRAGNNAAARRIDLVVQTPRRARVSITTSAGAVDAAGNLEEVAVETDTGTIRVDVPTTSVRFNFSWTASRPRFFSAVELPAARERSAGRFEIAGRLGNRDAERAERVRLELTTRRGIILFGVEERDVPADLRERPLTEAARAVLRHGNQTLIEAVRRVAPRNVAQFLGDLPARHIGGAPVLLNSRVTDSPNSLSANNPASNNGASTTNTPRLAHLNVNVTDAAGRAIGGLRAADFRVFENGEPRRVAEVVESETPFNLVLLLDVSGSVEERIDFIRRAALRFINTVSAQDRVAIITFRDDVQVISNFTTDRALLTSRTNLIEAGGATALYDAMAYTLVESLRPLRGERTAIVVLSDGDDNKSFLPFAAVLEAVVESGALIYPLYVPSGLIAASSNTARSDAASTITLDPTRTRFLTLTTRADEEGRRFAEASGGVYYPISQIEDIQRAFTDIVSQVRTSYTIVYESQAASSRVGAAPRVRVRVERAGALVRPGPSVVRSAASR
jgi:VWFA-related protein